MCCHVRVTGYESMAMLKQVKPTIVTYVGTREKALGQCNLSVVRKGVKHRITYNVLQGKYTPILSLDASEGMGLLKIKDCDPLDYVCTVNMVVVQKPNGQIRLCLDPKDLNVAIRREYYPMPTIEEVSTRLKKRQLRYNIVS